MTPADRILLPSISDYTPELALFLCRRSAMTIAAYDALDRRDATPPGPVRRALHDRLWRLAATLQGRSP